MIEFGTLPSVAQAGALIGAVLLEAVVLYVGYGAVEQAVGPALIERIKDA